MTEQEQKKMKLILSKLKSVELCLSAHPDNEKHSEFADRISDLQEIQKELSNLIELTKPVVPFFKQVFYVLFNKESKDFFHSNTSTHTFSAPLLLDAMIFKNKELAIKYKEKNKLKDFSIIKIIPQYYV